MRLVFPWLGESKQCLFQQWSRLFQGQPRFLLRSSSIDVFSSLIFCLLCNDQHLLSRNVLDRRNVRSASYVSCLLFLARLDEDVRKHLSILLRYENRLRFYASLSRSCYAMIHCRRKFQRSCHQNQTLGHGLRPSKEFYGYGQSARKRYLWHQFPFLTTHRG